MSSLCSFESYFSACQNFELGPLKKATATEKISPKGLKFGLAAMKELIMFLLTTEKLIFKFQGQE